MLCCWAQAGSSLPRAAASPVPGRRGLSSVHPPGVLLSAPLQQATGQGSTGGPFPQTQSPALLRPVSQLPVPHLSSEAPLRVEPLPSLPRRARSPNPLNGGLSWEQLGGPLDNSLLQVPTGSLAKTKPTLRKEIPQRVEYIDSWGGKSGRLLPTLARLCF